MRQSTSDITSDVEDQLHHKSTIEIRMQPLEKQKHFVFKCLSVATVDIIARFLAELIGTALLLLFGCAGGLAWHNQPPDFMGAISFGLVVMMTIQSFGDISGAHLNPSVSLSAMLYGVLSLPMFFVDFVAQILGAFFGFGILVHTAPAHLFGPKSAGTAGHCSTVPVDGLNVWQVFAIEFFATMLLITVNCSSWDPRTASRLDSISMRIGLTVIGLSIAVGPATGCSMNPARTLGPAIWNNDWTMHWVYWVAPLSSAVITTLLYKAIFTTPRPTEKRISESNSQ